MMFSYADYEALLAELLRSRTAITYPEIVKTTGSRCLLRHDIDYGLECFGDIPTIEHQMGVRATYFLQVRSDWYNLFCPAQLRILEATLKLGHRVGLHADCPADSTSHEAAERVAREMELLRVEVGEVDAVSFHQPPACILDNSVKIPYCNTYDKDDMSGFSYVSDSCQKWSKEDPIALFHATPEVSYQVLTHPVLWGRGLGFSGIASAVILQKAQGMYEYLRQHAKCDMAPLRCAFLPDEKKGEHK